MITRLTILCALHKWQGGTIHQFNEMYGVDFLAMTPGEFDAIIRQLSGGAQ